MLDTFRKKKRLAYNNRQSSSASPSTSSSCSPTRSQSAGDINFTSNVAKPQLTACIYNIATTTTTITPARTLEAGSVEAAIESHQEQDQQMEREPSATTIMSISAKTPNNDNDDYATILTASHSTSTPTTTTTTTTATTAATTTITTIAKEKDMSAVQDERLSAAQKTNSRQLHSGVGHLNILPRVQDKQPTTTGATDSVLKPFQLKHSVSLLNLFFYILCVGSLGFSLYSNVRQSHTEQRLRQLHQLDERITDLELQLQYLTLTLPPTSSSASSASSASAASTAPLLSKLQRETNDVNLHSNEVQQWQQLLTRQVGDLHRLRRDVSQLQLTRRQQRRQAAASAANTAEVLSNPTECTCTAGAYLPLINDKYHKLSFKQRVRVA